MGYVVLVFLLMSQFSLLHSGESEPKLDNKVDTKPVLRTPIYGLTQTKPAVDEGLLFEPYPEDQYLKILELIREIDPESYAMLKECSERLGIACVQHNLNYFGITYNKRGTDGVVYPILVPLLSPDHPSFKSRLIDNLQEFYKSAFNERHDYETNFITQEQRFYSLKKWLNKRWLDAFDRPLFRKIDPNNILSIVREIAPYLYGKIVEQDPLGRYNLKVYKEGIAAVRCSAYNGLPVFDIHPEFETLSKNEQRFILGHELGHFVLDHLHYTVSAPPKHLMLFPDSPAGQHSKEIFKMAKRRIRELEADRFAVINLGIDYRDGLEWMQREVREELEEPIKIFESSHPLFPQRIAHLQELGENLELGRERLNLMTPEDWDYAIARCFNQLV